MLQKLRKIVADALATPSTHGGYLKAMLMKAEAQRRPRRPKRRVHFGPIVETYDEHGRPILYQPRIDTSKYPGDRLREIRADGKHR